MFGSNRVFNHVPRLNPRARSLGFDDPFEDFEREIFGVHPVGTLGLEGSSSVDPSRFSDHLEQMFCDLAPLLGMPIQIESSAPVSGQLSRGPGKPGEERAVIGGQVAIKPVPGPQQGALSAYGRAPPVDIVERPNEYIIHIDVPGVQKENIKLQITQDQRGRKLLTVNGERKDEHHANEMQGFRSATALFGPFSRSLRLPKNVATDNIVAKCENGVLCISVPKVEVKPPELPPAKEISVE